MKHKLRSNLQHELQYAIPVTNIEQSRAALELRMAVANLVVDHISVVFA